MITFTRKNLGVSALAIAVLLLGIAIFALQAYYHKLPVDISSIPVPFAPSQNDKDLRATLTDLKSTGPIKTYAVTFSASQKTNFLPANAIYLVYIPGGTDNRPLESALRAANGNQPMEYFAYRYSDSMATAERAADPNAAFKTRFPGTFVASPKAMQMETQRAFPIQSFENTHPGVHFEHLDTLSGSTIGGPQYAQSQLWAFVGNNPGGMNFSIDAPNVCGDGWPKPGIEECDDGNTTNGDGCSSTCKLESGFECIDVWPSHCSALPPLSCVSASALSAANNGNLIVDNQDAAGYLEWVDGTPGSWKTVEKGYRSQERESVGPQHATAYWCIKDIPPGTYSLRATWKPNEINSPAGYYLRDVTNGAWSKLVAGDTAQQAGEPSDVVQSDGTRWKQLSAPSPTITLTASSNSIAVMLTNLRGDTGWNFIDSVLSDAIWLAPSVTPAQACGNGDIDYYLGEQCDEGPNNGTSELCNPLCKLRNVPANPFQP